MTQTGDSSPPAYGLRSERRRPAIPRLRPAASARN